MTYNLINFISKQTKLLMSHITAVYIPRHTVNYLKANIYIENARLKVLRNNEVGLILIGQLAWLK